MPLVRLSLLIVAVGSLLSCQSAPQAPEHAGLLVLHNLNLVDVEQGKLQANQLVVVQQDRIVAIAPEQDLAKYPDATQIDAGGQYLIPGLWDMHVHFEGRDLVEDNALLLPVYLAYGITGVREAAVLVS